jgi:hypothetical protein
MKGATAIVHPSRGAFIVAASKILVLCVGLCVSAKPDTLHDEARLERQAALRMELQATGRAMT